MTLFMRRDGYRTIYFYGTMMVTVLDEFIDGCLEDDIDRFSTHQMYGVRGDEVEENNRIMWERW